MRWRGWTRGTSTVSTRRGCRSPCAASPTPYRRGRRRTRRRASAAGPADPAPPPGRDRRAGAIWRGVPLAAIPRRAWRATRALVHRVASQALLFTAGRIPELLLLSYLNRRL